MEAVVVEDHEMEQRGQRGQGELLAIYGEMWGDQGESEVTGSSYGDMGEIWGKYKGRRRGDIGEI